ncbi:MAG: hypothetical protein BWX80_03362 [Candidatus Hydrogenedentes bacterium ADurb.Bin101]|nr:MAG: hypothetical protein BWX80_03362 [Candidatus Hydrogenedentes bacterium ADurb.Bin101]
MHLLVRDKQTQRLIIEAAQTRRKWYRKDSELHTSKSKKIRARGGHPLLHLPRYGEGTNKSIYTGTLRAGRAFSGCRPFWPFLPYAGLNSIQRSSGKAVKQSGGNYLTRRNPKT